MLMAFVYGYLAVVTIPRFLVYRGLKPSVRGPATAGVWRRWALDTDGIAHRHIGVGRSR